jgi:uncharacterized protein (DUF1778 family)
MPRRAKDERINLRIDADKKRLLEAASGSVGRSVSSFVLEAASVAAEQVLADRTVFCLDEQRWAAFDAALNAPSRDMPRLRRLLETPTVLGEQA